MRFDVRSLVPSLGFSFFVECMECSMYLMNFSRGQYRHLNARHFKMGLPTPDHISNIEVDPRAVHQTTKLPSRDEVSGGAAPPRAGSNRNSTTARSPPRSDRSFPLKATTPAHHEAANPRVAASLPSGPPAIRRKNVPSLFVPSLSIPSLFPFAPGSGTQSVFLFPGLIWRMFGPADKT